MTFTPNFNFDFNNNWQFQNQNWNSFQPMFNNNFGNLGGFNGFNFNNIWSSNTSGQTTPSSKTSSGDSDYDAWYEKRMKGAYSSASGEDSAKIATFLEEKSNEIVKTQALLDDTNKKIDALRKAKDNSSKVVDASLMQDTELNEDGTIKSTEKKEKGFFKKAANWLSSAGSALLSMGKSLIGFDKDGKLQDTCPECKTGKLTLKMGKFGAFIGCSNYPQCNYIKNIQSLSIADDSDVENNGEKFENKLLGTNEGQNIYLKKGPYGFYIQKGEDSTDKAKKPKRVGIPKTNKEPQNMTFEQAKALLSLPRLIGNHPEDNGEIKANIGPFGPYLMYNKAFYSVKNDDILTIELPKAVMIIEEGKKNKKAKEEKNTSNIKEKKTKTVTKKTSTVKITKSKATKK